MCNHRIGKEGFILVDFPVIPALHVADGRFFRYPGIRLPGFTGWLTAACHTIVMEQNLKNFRDYLFDYATLRVDSFVVWIQEG
jgi:hypothetical protein